MRPYCLIFLVLVLFTSTVSAQNQYFRCASSFEDFKLDKAPLAKNILSTDFETPDSVKVLGKVYYVRKTTAGQDIYIAKRKQGAMAFFADQDKSGFIIFTPADEQGNSDWSVYFRYLKKSKANKAPEAEDGNWYANRFIELYKGMIDQRTRTFYTVAYTLNNDHNEFGGTVPETQAFTLIGEDTIVMKEYKFFKIEGNYYSNKNSSHPIKLFKLDNGSLMLTKQVLTVGVGDVYAYFAPTKAMADKLLAEDYKPKSDAVALQTKANEIDKRNYETKEAASKKVKDAKQFEAMTNFVAGLKSVRTDPALDQAIRKKISLKDTPTTTIQKIYFMDADWVVVRNYYQEIVSKRIAALVVFKDSKDNSCYFSYWNAQYLYMGGGTYSTTLELGTTYPSQNNTSTQNSWIGVKNPSGPLINAYAGNYYDFDCKAGK